jgi:signal transduction histidine kinase
MRALHPTLPRAAEHPPFVRVGVRLKRAGEDPLVLAAFGLVVALALLTAAVVLHPQLTLVAVDARLDTMVNTIGTVVAAFVATASWIRFRETNRGATLLQAVAFLVLTLSGAFTLLAPLVGHGATLGMTLEDPGQVPVYRGLATRIALAALFLAAALALGRGWVPGRRTAPLLLVATALAVPAYLALLAIARADLPPLVDPAALQALRLGEVPNVFNGAGVVLVGASMLIGLGLVVAAVLYLRCYRTTGDRGLGLLGLGLMVAAGAQVHFGLFPAVHAGIVATEDYLGVAFAIMLLAGLVVDQHGDLRALRTAKLALARYRDADVQRARSEERARLARDLHDGLSQKLWRARLAHGRLVEQGSLDHEARRLAHETETALLEAIAEARLALDATRRAGGERSVAATIDGELDEFQRRTGVRTEISGRGRFDDLPREVGPELHGILREALSNVERHADATLVRVSLERTGDTLIVWIRDNGRGFHPTRRHHDRYGILGMQERVAILGGRLEIRSAPSAGTHVRITVPLGGGGPA